MNTEARANSRVVMINAALYSTVDELHAELKRLLGFPDYYGANFSAYRDCLEDVSYNLELAFKRTDEENDVAQAVQKIAGISAEVAFTKRNITVRFC